MDAQAKAGSLVLCLLEPCLELLLDHLQVLDVGGGMVRKRNLAGLLISTGETGCVNEASGKRGN